MNNTVTRRKVSQEAHQLKHETGEANLLKPNSQFVRFSSFSTSLLNNFRSNELKRCENGLHCD